MSKDTKYVNVMIRADCDDPSGNFVFDIFSLESTNFRVRQHLHELT